MRTFILCLAAMLPQETQEAPPDLVAEVKTAVVDGASALLHLKVEGAPAEGQALYIRPATKVLYVDLPRSRRTPAAGLFAEVWLQPGSRDAALQVRFHATKPPPPPPRMPAAVSLEAEKFSLLDVQIKELPGASAGKALLLVRPGARAETTVALLQGRYEVKIFMQGPDTDHDEVLVKVAGKQFRFIQEAWNTLAPGTVPDGGPPVVDVDREGEQKVVLEFAEAGVYVDRVLLVPVTVSATPDDEGFIRDWLILGPIPFEKPDARVELDRNTLKDEKEIRPRNGMSATVRHRELRWTRHQSEDYLIDFGKLFENATSGVAYAVCRIVAEQDLPDLQIRAGGNDLWKVYLNEREVMKESSKTGQLKDAKSAAGLTLRKGENIVILKVVNEGGRWQGCLRFTYANGHPVRTLGIGP